MRKNILALSIAAMTGGLGFAGMPAAPAQDYPSPFANPQARGRAFRSRVARRVQSAGQPAGSKLARRARQGRAGLAVIR